ncbi:4759_t:CDS:10, partial [Diversispora eburnea]
NSGPFEEVCLLIVPSFSTIHYVATQLSTDRHLSLPLNTDYEHRNTTEISTQTKQKWYIVLILFEKNATESQRSTNNANLEKLRDCLTAIKKENNINRRKKAMALLDDFEPWIKSTSCESYWLQVETSLSMSAHEVTGRKAAYRTIKNFTQKVNDEEEVMDEFQPPLTRARKRARKELKPENQAIDKDEDEPISKQNARDVLKDDEIQSTHINDYSSSREPTDEEIPQENEEEAETEKELDINYIENPLSENEERETILNDIQSPDGDLIDLRLNSPFFKKLPRQIATSYMTEMDNITESLVPKNVHEFLVKFFSQNLSAKEWNYRIDDLRAPEKDDFILNTVVRVLRHTLPQFIKAFSLEEQNPLFNVTTLEHAHLNAFVHPCIDTFLWYIADIHYEYGEISSKNHINRNRADGVGFMTDADKHQLIYLEGSRPMAKDKKEIDDTTITEKAVYFRWSEFSPPDTFIFSRLLRLNEVDNANLPRKFSEMKSFVYFYESILKWALLVRDVTASFDNARTEQRPSRLSFADALLRLGD